MSENGSCWRCSTLGERGGPKQKRLDKMLEESIRNLGIEHIHYAGKDNYNANSATHVPLNWSGQTVKSVPQL